jgi:hypothetical protein
MHGPQRRTPTGTPDRVVPTCYFFLCVSNQIDCKIEQASETHTKRGEKAAGIFWHRLPPEV